MGLAPSPEWCRRFGEVTWRDIRRHGAAGVKPFFGKVLTPVSMRTFRPRRLTVVETSAVMNNRGHGVEALLSEQYIAIRARLNAPSASYRTG